MRDARVLRQGRNGCEDHRVIDPAPAAAFGAIEQEEWRQQLIPAGSLGGARSPVDRASDWRWLYLQHAFCGGERAAGSMYGCPHRADATDNDRERRPALSNRSATPRPSMYNAALVVLEHRLPAMIDECVVRCAVRSHSGRCCAQRNICSPLIRHHRCGVPKQTGYMPSSPEWKRALRVTGACIRSI